MDQVHGCFKFMFFETISNLQSNPHSASYNIHAYIHDSFKKYSIV